MSWSFCGTLGVTPSWNLPQRSPRRRSSGQGGALRDLPFPTHLLFSLFEHGLIAQSHFFADHKPKTWGEVGKGLAAAYAPPAWFSKVMEHFDAPVDLGGFGGVKGISVQHPVVAWRGLGPGAWERGTGDG